MAALDVPTPQQYRAVANGVLHRLGDFFPSLAAAQTVFPFAQSLGESIDRCAIQKCLNQAVDSRRYGRTIYLGPGDYVLDQHLVLQTALGVRILGAGASTRLWSTNGAQLQLIGCQECQLEQLVLHGDGTNAGVLLTNPATPSPTGIVSTGNRFVAVRFENCQQGCVVAGGAGGDVNNDSHVWRDCVFDNCRQTGLQVAGSSQAHFLRFEDTTFNGGTHGIWCQYGCYIHAQQCTFNGHQMAVRLDDFFPGVCSLLSCNGENLGGLIQTGANGHGPAGVVEVRRGRFAFALQPGSYALDFDHEGPFVVSGNRFEAINDVQPRIALRWGAGRVEHTNNSYHCVGTWTGTALQPLNGRPVRSVTDVGNCYISNDQNTTAFFDSATPVGAWS